MEDEKLKEQFKRAKKYNTIGFLIILLSPFSLLTFDGTVKYISAIIIFGIGIYLQRKYKCPACGNVFDPRQQADELIFCPKCGRKLQ